MNATSFVVPQSSFNFHPTTGVTLYILVKCCVVQVLKAFDCQDFDDGTSYLKADYDLNCDSNRYTFVKVSKT